MVVAENRRRGSLPSYQTALRTSWWLAAYEHRIGKVDLLAPWRFHLYKRRLRFAIFDDELEASCQSIGLVSMSSLLYPKAVYKERVTYLLQEAGQPH